MFLTKLACPYVCPGSLPTAVGMKLEPLSLRSRISYVKDFLIAQVSREKS